MELESFYQEEASLEEHFKRLIKYKIHDWLGVSESELEEALYSQPQSTLLDAFIHTSYTKAAKNLPTYERLEYLGDSIIYFLMSSFLYKSHPFYTPGQLSLLRQKLVSTSTLIKVTKQLNLDKLIITTPDLQLPEHSRILADIFESFVGAVYLNFGIKITQNFIEKVLITHQLDECTIEKDYKTQVQEVFQEVPGCRIIYKSHKNNRDEFRVDLTYCGITYGSGWGKNKKAAEQNAARDALEKLCTLEEIELETQDLASSGSNDCLFTEIRSSVDSPQTPEVVEQNSWNNLGNKENSVYEIIWSFSSWKVE